MCDWQAPQNSLDLPASLNVDCLKLLNQETSQLSKTANAAAANLLQGKTKQAGTLVLTKAFTLVGGTVNKDFGRDDIAKRQKHLHELRISELLGQVINKQVTAFGTWDNTHAHTKDSHTLAKRPQVPTSSFSDLGSILPQFSFQ